MGFPAMTHILASPLCVGFTNQPWSPQRHERDPAEFIYAMYPIYARHFGNLDHGSRRICTSGDARKDINLGPDSRWSIACSRLQRVGTWMYDELWWLSFCLWFGIGGRSCSNFLASTVSQVAPYFRNPGSLCEAFGRSEKCRLCDRLWMAPPFNVFLNNFAG